MSSLFTIGQDTTYFDNNLKKANSIKDASYYKVVLRQQPDTNQAIETFYFKSGKIKSQKSYTNYKDKKIEGKAKEWYESGQIRKNIDYKEGKKNGQLLTFWDNGNPKRIDTYKNDSLIEGKCMNPDGTKTTYYDYEKLPEFPGGKNELRQYLSKEIKYPKKSRKEDVEGRVLVYYIVNENGTISDIKIAQGVNDELDKEAIRVVKNMPNWEPGMQDGEAVKIGFYLPILFRLE
jgi:protein TonB